MVKHWPGGGAVEGGRDAHFGCGKYSVYPGNNFEEHMIPFTEGAFKLKDGTKSASAVMPYYTIIHGQIGEDECGCSYSRYLVTDLLRERFGFDGVVCTDWNITYDETTVMIFTPENAGCGKPVFRQNAVTKLSWPALISLAV